MFDDDFSKAKNGDVKSQYIVGNHYYYGEGVAQDKSEALKWYKKSAFYGNSDAQVMIGIIILYDEIVPINHEEALSLFIKSSAKGNSKAMIQLGLYFLNGEGDKKDIFNAYRYFKKAQKKGNFEANQYLINLNRRDVILSFFTKETRIITLYSIYFFIIFFLQYSYDELNLVFSFNFNSAQIILIIPLLVLIILNFIYKKNVRNLLITLFIVIILINTVFSYYLK